LRLNMVIMVIRVILGLLEVIRVILGLMEVIRVILELPAGVLGLLTEVTRATKVIRVLFG
jgi:hypothetical protein